MSFMKIKNFATYAKQDLLKNNKNVRDHCYFTGKYRGTAHNKCNMNYKISKNIPIVLHNSSTYDYYFYNQRTCQRI